MSKPFSKLLDKLGFQRTADVWEANERLKGKLSLAEKTVAAHETNANLSYAYYVRTTEKRAEIERKYRDACLRIIELEEECNQWSKQEPNGLTPYPKGATKYSRENADG